MPTNNSSFRETFQKQIRPEMQKKYNYKSIMAVPEIEKLVINVGLGEATVDKKHIADAIKEFTIITGQKPAFTTARKSIAGFKLREKMPIGIKITLRKTRMYKFIFRLVHIVFPRIRDFRGIPKTGFDKNGNYNMGLKEQIVFSEVNYDQIKINKGMNLTFVIRNSTPEKSLQLLREMGFPIR